MNADVSNTSALENNKVSSFAQGIEIAV
jgi:hypothetical protein